MRILPLVAAAFAVVACAGGPAGRLRPAAPAEAVAGEPLAARADVGGVSIQARVGDWRGWPRDLEQRLTPVVVTLVNNARRPVRMAPESFSLAVAGGGRYSPMDQRQVSRALSDLAGFRGPRPPFRQPGTPGFDVPGRDPVLTPPTPNAPVPGPGDWQAPFNESGTLGPGESVQTVLYFDVPAVSLREATLDVAVADESGVKLGDARMPFARG